MTTKESDGYDRAMMLLPYELRERFRHVLRQDRLRAEELRLRTGRTPTVLLPDGELDLGGAAVRTEDIEKTLDIVTRASIHAAAESIRMGFLTAQGGFRVGLCGSAVTTGGRVDMLRSISSVCIRIPHAVTGIAEEVLPRLCSGGTFESTLLLSPPGGGKTTLLRDIVRLLSDGSAGLGVRPHRVALADERGEVAAMYGGAAQHDVGAHTDVMDMCPKAQAVTMMLRAMNPEVIAVDEITAPADAEVMISASGCGAALLATAHAKNVHTLNEKEVYRRLLNAGVFRNVVTITVEGGCRCYRTERLPVSGGTQ